MPAIAQGSFRRTLYAKRRKVGSSNEGATDEYDKESLLGKINKGVKSETLKKLKKITGGKAKRYS